MTEKIKRLFLMFQKNNAVNASCVFSVIYFLCLLRFYVIDYYVPDFRLYSSFPIANYVSKDAFSSLFIQICGLITIAPRLMTILCLLLQVISLCFITKAAYNFLYGKSHFSYWFSVLIIYSASIWYYFYGKLFYEFPFTAALYGLLFYIVSGIYISAGMEKHNIRYWYYISFLSGFIMSWKMYNIFAVAGLGLLFLAKKETRAFWTKEILHCKQLLLTLVLALAGYLLPNYWIFIHPVQTLKGLSGYEASYKFSLFMLSKTNIVWDHVTDLPFGIATFCLISAVIICFVIPVVNRQWIYVLVSVFMTICLAVFITGFSTGHCWHGFTSGLFIVTFAVFILSETEPIQVNRRLFCIAAVCQILICFGYYIPKQIHWFNVTNAAIGELEESEHEIYTDICDLADTLDGTYTVDLAVKRYTPVPTSAMSFQYPKRGVSRYFTATNYTFLNPLEATNYFAWRQLESEERYMDNDGAHMPDCSYILYIIPKSFMTMSDVANIHKYDDADIVWELYRDHYAVYVISWK